MQLQGLALLSYRQNIFYRYQYPNVPMSQITIAVAIPTYKRKEMLQQLIDSVPAEWNVFVSDNDSSLVPMDKPYAAHVTVSHAPTLVPIFANWNRALSLVDQSATHVVIPSDDDVFLPGALDIVHNAVERHQEADILFFGCDLFDETGRRWPGYLPDSLQAFGPGEGFQMFQYGVDARMPGVVFRRAFLEQIGAFDERFKLTAGDSELIQRALLLGRAVFIPTLIGLYRVWQGGLTHTRQATDEWLEEIGLWTGKLAALMQSGGLDKRLGIDIDRYQDEILAQNLHAGLNKLVANQSFTEARQFLARHRIPKKARFVTRLRLFRCAWTILRAPR